MAAGLPHLLDRGEVLLGVGREQLPLVGLLEAGDDGFLDVVGEGVGLHHGGPRLGLGLGGRAGRPAGGGVLLAGGGVVAGELRLDRGLVGAAGGDQAAEQGPAQLGVDGQALDGAGAVEQGGEQVELAVRPGGAGQGAGPGELVVAAGGGVEQRGLGGLGPALEAGLAPRRVGVHFEGELDLALHGLDDADVALAAQAGQCQRQVVAGGEFAVAGHVPGGGPAQRAGERVGEVAEVLGDDGQRVGVEADLRVGQVVVVEQQHGGPLTAGQLRDLGALAVHVELDPVGADQVAVDQLVQADGDAVRPQHGLAAGAGGQRGGFLQDGEGLDDAVRGDLDRGAQHVDAGGLQPGLGPGAQVAAAGLLEGAEQVGEARVAPGVALEVGAHALEEGVLADVGDQLLEHRGALGVGDAVEVDLDVLQVVDLRHDRVGGRQLVLPVRPGLHLVGEGGPGVRPLGAGGLGLADGLGESGERLVQPEVVPPLHGDEVAEPHVGELVQDGRGAQLVGGVGDLGTEHVLVAEGDGARVLHRTGVELRDEQLVVLREGVGEVELVLEVVEALLGDVEDGVGVQELAQRGAAVDAERHALRAVLVGVEDADVRAGHQGGDVGGHPRGGLEGPHPGVALAGGLGGRRVGDHDPAGRGGDREGERGLQVGLLEVGEHPPGVGDFELGVEVGLAVGRVDEPVQTLAGVGVRAVGDHPQLVLGGQLGQRDPAVGEALRRQRAAVEDDLRDGGGDQVDEGGGAGLGGGEPDHGGGPEGAALARRAQVELDVVRLHMQERGPGAGLLTGQVGARHSQDSFVRAWLPGILPRE